MIHGVGTRHASQSRAPNDARTITRRPTDPAMAGSSSRTRIRRGRRPGAAASVAKPNLADRPPDLAQLKIVLSQPHVGNRVRQVGNNAALDSRSARAFLKSADIQLDDTVERVHLLDIFDRLTRHLSPQFL